MNVDTNTPQAHASSISRAGFSPTVAAQPHVFHSSLNTRLTDTSSVSQRMKPLPRPHIMTRPCSQPAR